MASKNNEIPKHELQALAKAFADDIIAFFESEEGQKEYEEWLQQKKDNKRLQLPSCSLAKRDRLSDLFTKSIWNLKIVKIPFELILCGKTGVG
jgi:hypothetical protein